MARFAKGRRALAISDRSGAAFPYNEMVKNGMELLYITLNLKLNNHN